MASIFRDKILLSGKNTVLLYMDAFLSLIRLALFFIAIKFNMALIDYIALVALTLVLFNFVNVFYSLKKN